MSDGKFIKYEFAEEGAKKVLEEVILQTLIKIHGNAVSLCPVQYGQLRNSLMWKFEDREGGFNSQEGEQAPYSQKLDIETGVLKGAIGTGSDHWYIEFGTKNQVGQPFLRPARDLVRGSSVATIVQKYGKKAMEKAYRNRKRKVKIKKFFAKFF